MAYFAELDENNEVISIHTIANIDNCNSDGIEEEEVGKNYLK